MDWQLTCRICLETGDMVSLFDWDENNEQLADKYAYCCGIEVPKNDTLPTLICLGCVDKLTESYQFKQQCLSSVDTLKECLEEFVKTSSAATEHNDDKEVITIKQENGTLLQYELPIENDKTYTRMMTKSANKSVVTLAPNAKKRGRRRKYPDPQGQIPLSPYAHKKQRKMTPKQSLTELIEGAAMKEEPADTEPEEEDAGDIDDPDFAADEHDDDRDEEIVHDAPSKKRGRPRKNQVKNQLKMSENMDADTEDMLLQETILAMSEPIPDHVINPKPKKPRSNMPKKKYNYEKTHTCETCGSSFGSNSTLQAHIRRHLGIKPFVCSVCGYACVLKMELRRHMFKHTGAKPYQCRICERSFADFGSRQKHESVCGFSCVAKEALTRHMYKHTGERPYKCRWCNRCYSDYGARQKHERLHMGLRPYTCSVCGKSFTYSYVLSNHMLIHTGEKKYQCVPCSRKFTKAHHLKYHNKVHHKELYKQLEEEAKERKQRQQLNLTGLAGVITGHIVDGKLQIITDHHGEEGDTEQEGMMQVVEISQEEGGDIEEGDENEEAVENEELETDRAVASMQAELSGEEYITS